MMIQAGARRLGLGKLAYDWYFEPLGRFRRMLREGGPGEQRRTELGRREMERAAYGLPPITPTTQSAVALHVLTGSRFWYQSAFCLWSFARAAGRSVAPVIIDDGSLTDAQRDTLSRLFPHARHVAHGECASRLDEQLPASRFPVLRERWRNYPHIRKLIDVHLVGGGWKLVLDSDLLFFRHPAMLIDWLDRPARPLHAVDIATSYGYPTALMGSLAGSPVAERVNVGLTGLRSDGIDWEKLESWSASLLADSGPHYFLEQALVAMLVAGIECDVAPREDYVTMPSRHEALRRDAVMHHYVEQSKRWYFQHNWRHLVAASAS